MIGEYESDCRDALLDAPRMYGLSQQHKHLPKITALNGLECAPDFLPDCIRLLLRNGNHHPTLRF